MKILIVSEIIAGKGHEKAAYSIAKAINTLGLTHDVKIVNLLSIVSKSVEKAINIIYITMIKRFPYLWHWMYKKESGFASVFKEVIANVIQIRIQDFIESEKPDIVVATHPTGLGALSKLKRKYHYQLAAVFTDFHINSFWIHENIDFYFVPHDNFKDIMVKTYNVTDKKVFVTGIPIDPAFSNNKDSKEMSIESIKRNGEYFKILIMGGGLGLGGMNNIIESVNKIDDIPLKLVAVTGTNKKLYNHLIKQKSSFKKPVEIMQFVDDIYSLMNNSHLLISKSGGLTVSEALSVPIPLLIYKPIPGQEVQNLKFLIKNKSAIHVKNTEEIAYWIRYLYHKPKLYLNLIKREQILAKPDSSKEISRILLEILV